MDELQISGKRFISSRRIARENGYTSDYIGQLIRGGKVVGQKVGRAWYVDAISFDTYLGSEGITVSPSIPLEDPEPVGVVVPVAAPVVEKEIFHAPEAEVESKTTEIVEEPEVASGVIEDAIEIDTQHVPLRITKAEASGGLRYYADDAPSLPEIRSNEKESRVIAHAEEESGEAQSVMSVQPIKNVGRRYVASLAVLGITIFIFSAVVSSTLSLNLSIEAGNTATTFYSLGWKH